MAFLQAGRAVLATFIAAGAAACASPSQPSTISSLAISSPSPQPGAVIPATKRGIQYFVDRGSGIIAVPITVTSGRDVPWAQLYVYLYESSGQYCGQNLPDAPTWGPFSKGQRESVTITGFQIFRVPCTVTSIRGWLHTRNSGNLTPPTASETVAEGSAVVHYTFVEATGP